MLDSFRRYVDRFGCSRVTGSVAVETQVHVVCVLPKLGRLFGGERRTQRRNRVLESGLVHRYAVEVPLDHNQGAIALRGPARDVERVEMLPFGVDRRSGGIEVFRLGIAERAAAE